MYKDYKIVALCISKVHLQLIRSFIESLNNILTPLGYRILIFHTCTDLYRGTLMDSAERTIFDIIPFDLLEALILYDESFFDKWSIRRVIQEAHAHRVPVISVGAKQENCYNVIYQYEDAFSTVVEHLIQKHGVKDICMIGGLKGNFFSDERLATFCKVMEKYQLPCDDSHIYYGNLWEQPTREASEAIIASGHIPEAIVCVNDYTAITVCDVFQKHGFRIPEDILITGFDGTTEAACSFPSITTCHCDMKNVANHISGILSNLERGSTSTYINRIPFSLVPGASCGCGSNVSSMDIGGRLRESEDRLNGYIDFEAHLYELAEKLILCQTYKEQKSYLNNLRITNCAIMLNCNYMDPSVNPTLHNQGEPFTSEMLVSYSNNIPESFVSERISLEELAPGLDYMLDCEVPVLFNALSYLGSPMGYVCFFCEPTQTNYCHIIQNVTMLNQAFGGARNVQYLHNIARNMEELSSRDSMTKLLNRNGFFKYLTSFLSACEGKKLLLASIDMDGLKYINDNYGHSEGDRAIQNTAQAIEKLPFSKKLSARFGGDEFILIVCQDEVITPDEIAENLDASLTQVVSQYKLPYPITVSIGCVEARSTDFEFESLVKKSDEIMRAIKQSKPHHRI